MFSSVPPPPFFLPLLDSILSALYPLLGAIYRPSEPAVASVPSPCPQRLLQCPRRAPNFAAGLVYLLLLAQPRVKLSIRASKVEWDRCTGADVGLYHVLRPMPGAATTGTEEDIRFTDVEEWLVFVLLAACAPTGFNAATVLLLPI